MTREVNIEVYCDSGPNGGKDIFAVVSDHRPDLPKPFDAPLQEWARENFSNLEKGESVEEAGKLIYRPDEEIVEYKLTE